MTEREIKILLVEDNPDDVRIVQILLSTFPADIEVASSLFECNERLSIGGVDVVLLDLSLPDSKGLETFKMAYNLAPELPFILLTGNDDASLAIEAVRYGAEDYLVKGEFGNKLLWRVIRYAIERKSGRKQVLEALKRAQESDLLKSRFLTKMNHDFRTPINAILGMASLMLFTPDMGDEKKSKFLNRIKINGEQLLSMVDSILEMMKIDSGRISPKKLDFKFHRIISHLCDGYKIQAENEGLEFICSVDDSIPEVIQGDPLFLERILNNLVSNALKYTDEGSVALETSLKERSEDNVTLHFKVIDTGIGIAEEDIETIFESFFQVDSSMTTDYTGTGLGLPIAKELAEMMGGEIWVESEPQKGTIFHFVCSFLLPYSENPGENN